MKAGKIFAKNFRRLIAESGKTQMDISEGIGVSNTTICRYANANFSPKIDKLDAIADYFGVSVSDLFKE